MVKWWKMTISHSIWGTLCSEWQPPISSEATPRSSGQNSTTFEFETPEFIQNQAKTMFNALGNFTAVDGHIIQTPHPWVVGYPLSPQISTLWFRIFVPDPRVWFCLIYFVHSKERTKPKKRHCNWGRGGLLDYKGLNNSSIYGMSPCMSQFVEGKHNMHNLTLVWSRRTRPAFIMLAPGKLFPSLAKFPESGGANVSRATPSFPPIRIANVSPILRHTPLNLRIGLAIEGIDHTELTIP